MIIHLDRIHEQPFTWSETMSVPAEIVAQAELVGLGEVSCEGRVERASPGFHLEARLEYEQTVACTRCLKDLTQPMEVDVELMIVVRPAEPAHGELQLDADDLGVLAVDDERLDTEPILREQIELNVPMRALCSEECAGLCPRCGADRNLDPECCEGPPADPRWKALEDWKSS